MSRGRNVRYISPKGNVWHLHGDQMGEEGVYLTSLSGIYHPERVPTVLTPAYKRGAIPGPPKTNASRVGLKIFTSAENSAEWERVESRWWSDWSDEEDGILQVESLSDGSYRWQPIRIESYPSDPFDYEPEEDMAWTMSCISYDPGWRGRLITSSATGTGAKTIKLANPGDVELWPHFAGEPKSGIKLPDGLGATLGATAAQDKSMVPLPDDMDPSEGDWLVITDQLEVPIENTANTQVVARMAGMLFQHPVPPGTWPPVEVPIRLGDSDTTVRAYMQTVYQRPWG
ncbi:minor tail protein [Gordonia phage Trine]|uniref:Minor tail protein n=1 Tax=Gordonia phage Trine TaxID=2201431 RepID=A0A2Z4Q9L2_9CAUD|nr:minor tail protein [Gordonia phage Trine]AWY06519.1 minor tail protein [Gordonia phage Trine]